VPKKGVGGKKGLSKQRGWPMWLKKKRGRSSKKKKVISKRGKACAGKYQIFKKKGCYFERELKREGGGYFLGDIRASHPLKRGKPLGMKGVS